MSSSSNNDGVKAGVKTSLNVHDSVSSSHVSLDESLESLNPQKLKASRSSGDSDNQKDNEASQNPEVEHDVDSETLRFSDVSLSSSYHEIEDREDGRIQELLDAAQTGQLSAIIHLITALHIPSDSRGFLGWTPAHWAARMGHIHVLNYLQSIGANLDVVDDRGDGLLHKAAANGQVSTTNWLLQNGFNAHIRNNLGILPLQLAKEHATFNSWSTQASKCARLLSNEEATNFTLSS